MNSKYGVTLSRSDHLRLKPHPDAPPEDSWRAWVASLDKPVAVDLFCGAGGLSLGLQQAGFEVVAAVDTDEHALATHRANFPGRALKMDLADPEQVDDLAEQLSEIEIDVLAGGPPCQPFSRAGRSKIRSLVKQGIRHPDDERRDLWQVFIDLTKRLQPSSVLFENVPDIALADESRIVRSMAEAFENLGYAVDFRLLDAWRYGVPQHRQRLFLVAVRDGLPFEWPEPSDRQVTVEDAIADLPHLEGGTGGRRLRYGKPSTEFQHKARIGMPNKDDAVVWDHMTRPVREDDREAFALMKPNTRYSELPEHLRRYRSDIFDDKYKRLDPNGLSRTITAHIAKDGYWYIHPSEHRTLTVREASRLQTFPDRFRFEGARSHAFAQIGNAVPPSLATAISKSIKNSLTRTNLQNTNLATTSNRLHTFRQNIWNWEPSGSNLWRRIGKPWPVLVSTICGRKGSGDTLAHNIINILPYLPKNGNISSKNLYQLAKGNDPSSHRVLRSISAANSILKYSWHSEQWTERSRLGPSDIRWVKTVGLKQDNLIATTGILRFANRFDGIPEDTPAQTRVVLARLIGNHQTLRTTVAIAALATEICTATEPRCMECPLVKECNLHIAAKNTLSVLVSNER